MATVLNPHKERHFTSSRTLPQKVCIGIGIVFILAGLAGFVLPGLFELHLSFAHNLIHLVSGAVALWAGYSDENQRAYQFCVGFGVVYGLLGLSGFIFGAPGFPGVGHGEADENLLRIIPTALELGTSDHLLHIILSSVLIGSAYVWKRQTRSASKIIVDHQARTDFSRSHRETADLLKEDARDLRNSESHLKDADLGRSDINRRSDQGRRSDFERRI